MPPRFRPCLADPSMVLPGMSGVQFTLSPLTAVRPDSELLSFVQGARIGDRFIYAVGRVTPRGHPTFRLAGALAEARRVTLVQRRRDDGLIEWIAERRREVSAPDTVAVATDEDDDTVLRAIKRRINFGRAMATNEELAKECGLKDAARASYVLRRLRQRGTIRLIEPGPGKRRVVTIVATGARTVEGDL